ncbi:PREDICTED: baculoviral IAP repeat-containing protein 6 isoform X4 [Papilio xuthus]|uniref:Baculoviral IAP repeat-containing protein 6 isoform X4 n=1 Tax=Papilio xuthus TaxID=66420 RepID=A0AAJ6ZEF8_PAPXU|nr:PREDICTED: baculoviral IAP repeat-containing protein 6 isoform X4 [Papilio xuthus]
MGDDSLILREDGYIRMNFPVSSLTYHSNLNIILVKTDVGGVHVLDVNSGVILQSSCLSADEGGTVGVEYASGADRVLLWDRSGVGARTDYNGVLLLHTALQRRLPSPQPETVVKIELVLSEAVILYQCLQNLDVNAIEGLQDFVNALKTAIDAEPTRKGVKAQKWSTVTISLPQVTFRLVTAAVVHELKGQNRRVPALAIASAVRQRANELMPSARDGETRALMYSEAERKETFKRWPHMDYNGGICDVTRWALPARMAQAGFYHQPSPSGDDRAMCFTCMVCLVCWEKSDEPWVEHERHSPNCPFVRGEYTHNVPISVSNATACAHPCPDISVVSKGNTGDLVATGTAEGKVSLWRFDSGLKFVNVVNLSPYDSIFSGILATESNKVWAASLEKDSSTYDLELTAMAFIGMTSKQATYQQNQSTEANEKESSGVKSKPSLVCAVIVTRTNCVQEDQPLADDVNKALFDSGGVSQSDESIKEMNDQNEAKNNQTSEKMLFLLTYDIYGSLGGTVATVVHTSNSSANSKPGGSKKIPLLPVPRTDEGNIYDEIYFQYSDEETELPQCPNLLDEHISNVINLNASSSKEICKFWDTKKIMFAKHYKVLAPSPPSALLPELPEPGQTTIIDFVGNLSQLKSWKSGNLDSVGTKLADQPDAIQIGPPTIPPTITHYFNMNGPLEISDLKWYEDGEGIEKIKIPPFTVCKPGTETAVSNSNNDGFDSDANQEEPLYPIVAVQCLRLPTNLDINDASKITHLLPTEDKEHLLVVVSGIESAKSKPEPEADGNSDMNMDVDESEIDSTVKDSKAHFLLYKINKKTSVYTLDDQPVLVKELPYNESPVDLCLMPADKHDQCSLAAVGVDGTLRMYSMSDFNMLSEKSLPNSQFTSVVYCTSVERLSVATKQGMIYFYALNDGEKDSAGAVVEDHYSNVDLDMLWYESLSGPTSPPVIIANKPELNITDLETLITLSGMYGSNDTVPYSTVVPGFWCELSPAQRSRSDHQNNRCWRLQNTSSTWDEHVLELTMPYSVSLAHIEFSFTLHNASTGNLPVIQVTLLKQNLHGVGYKKDASFCQRADSPVHFPVVDSDGPNIENPVNSEEYLQAHNAEILAGPLLLSSGLDLTQQSGTLILTSPRLFRARGRTFLIHIKTLFDPAKDMTKGPTKFGESSKKTGFIGCDWLHQISITVRSSPHTELPMEKQQRIAMLESNTFLDTLCEIATKKGGNEERRLALDLLNWVLSVRLQRMRLVEKGQDKEAESPVETQQLECVAVIEKHIEALVKNCILCANRSIAKKCIKIILITSEGVKQLPKPWKCTFESRLSQCVVSCVPYVGACGSPGALKWLAALAQHAVPPHAAPALLAHCCRLLDLASKCLQDRTDLYHHLLRARFGLYGLPLERSIFTTEVPELGRAASTQASSSDDTGPIIRPDHQLKDLLNLPINTEGKSNGSSSGAWWASGPASTACGVAAGEALALHVTSYVASDGTKLESVVARHQPAVVSALPTDSQQLWTVVKEGHGKQQSQDPDSLDDVESSMMECDPQDKPETPGDNFFTQEEEQCGIPWATLVSKPPQHTLVVERMHSGARRYIVLDFGHTVRLTDVIIPSCSDLVTLCIDIWVAGEETDCVKLAFASDIATKHLVLTDIQPPPLCRYMKITTIGRYGMSAMKCKIPLGWFYGEIAEVPNVQASINALNALHQDLSCRFRLATGKLIDLLNPYLEMYNGNAANMMAYFNLANEVDPKVVAAYQECMELQQQVHNCNNILRKLSNGADCNERALDMINRGAVTAEDLLLRASTDKLRVIAENVVDMLLYFVFQMDEVQFPEVSSEWFSCVSSLLWSCGARGAASLSTLLARLCGSADWWGDRLADLLCDAFSPHDAPPRPLDRCLVVVMYMCRKSMYAHLETGGTGVAAALAKRALTLLRASEPRPAPLIALLTALASVLDAALPPPNTVLMPVANATPAAQRLKRWEWLTGGLAGAGGAGGADAAGERGDCKLPRRKLHKKLLNHMHEIESVRRARHRIKARLVSSGKLGGVVSTKAEDMERATRLVPPALAVQLAQALVAHLLAADSSVSGETLLLCAKVVGRLCAASGGASLLEPASVLGLARLAVTLPPWPRHALITLLQDLVEYENLDGTPSPTSDEPTWSDTNTTRPTVTQDDIGARTPPRKNKAGSVADSLAASFGLSKSGKPKSKPKVAATALAAANAVKTIEYRLSQVAELEVLLDSETEDKQDSDFVELKRFKIKPIGDNFNTSISTCVDARLESGVAAAGEALARRLLAATSGALAAALRPASTPPVTPPLSPGMSPVPSPAGPASPPAAGPSHQAIASSSASAALRAHPPLTHTLYDVFRHLALEFPQQRDCSLMENVLSLWMTLNGCAWGAGGAGGAGSSGSATGSGAWSTVPSDTPRVRLAPDTVTAILHQLCTVDNISLRCWILSMQSLAWIAGLPLQSEGGAQTLGRFVLESEYFVPALVKFISMDVNVDCAVNCSESYLSGSSVGAGQGAASALQAVLTRVVKARSGAGALVALRVLAALWAPQRAHDSAQPLDLHAALLRAAHDLVPSLASQHLHYAMPLIRSIATQSLWWMRGAGGVRNEASAEARLTGLLADILPPGAAPARRVPPRRAVLAHLLYYARRLLALPLLMSTQQGQVESGEQSQTDESKALDLVDGTNLEDERKHLPRAPCLADAVLQEADIMQDFYATLSVCDGLNTFILNSGTNTESSTEFSSLKEEIYWLVAQLPTVASNAALMVPSLMDFLRKKDVINLSQAMQQLIVKLLDKSEALAAFIEAGGLELSVEKLTTCHQSGPSNSQGLVSSLMNHLKVPPQIINMSTAAGAKKTQPPITDTANGLVNIAPLCTVSCDNPTAQAADVLLDGGGLSAGVCAARRVRAAAWSYHFFSADDASLALTLTLPYAAQLHEVHLQPHLTSLATCPGAVSIEASCGGPLVSLGPPQVTAGMTFIRLVLARPAVASTVQLRLYKPRDSSYMGLLQLRVIVAPAFAAPTIHAPNGYSNNWVCVVAACTRAQLESSRWARVGSPAAVRALCAAVLATRGSSPQAHGHTSFAAHTALLAAARACPELRAPLLNAILATDEHAYVHSFQMCGSGPGGVSAGACITAVCWAARQLCRRCPEGTTAAFVHWLAEVAQRPRRAPSAALLHTLASVLWSLKEERLLDNLEELITDELFDLLFVWVQEVDEISFLKKALDAILCSMCYIRPDLFKKLMEHIGVPVDNDESMEGLTDDRKVHQPLRVTRAGASGGGCGSGAVDAATCGAAAAAVRLRRRELRTLAAAALSPAATLLLLHSPLPHALVRCVAEYSETKLQQIKEQLNTQEDVYMKDAEIEPNQTVTTPSMQHISDIVEWARLMCVDRRFKDWLGAAGNTFWRPLLSMLCYPRPRASSWQESSEYANLEEHTIRLFAELTVCHASNQKLFASTLHNILESMQNTRPEGLSGFTRSLILRLVLSSERGTVALRWAAVGADTGAGAAASNSAPPHPSMHCHALLSLPLHTTIRSLLTEHRPPLDEATRMSLSNAVPAMWRSASDAAVRTVAEAWELSLAAASASKDKRVKDAKNNSLKQQGNKKRQSKPSTDNSVLSLAEEFVETTIRVQSTGLEGFVPGNVTLAQLVAVCPHKFGPHLALILHLNTNGEIRPSDTWDGSSSSGGSNVSGVGGMALGVLHWFAQCGGLALVAARLPRPHAPPVPPPAPSAHHHDLDWVKLEDPYDDLVDLGGAGGPGAGGGGGGAGGGEEQCAGVPVHALVALGPLLKLPGYAAALLDEGPRAVHLLRLLLGVSHDEDGRQYKYYKSKNVNDKELSAIKGNIAVGSVVSGGSGGGAKGEGSWSLGTLPFRVLARLLHAAPPDTDDGRSLRSALLRLGLVRLLLACLAVFTHHKPASNDNSQASNGSGKPEEKSQLYWAKGTGFGTGSTQQSWNVEQALVRQRVEEEHVTVLLEVLSAYMNPGERWPPEEGAPQPSPEGEERDHHLPHEFVDLIANSSLLPAICSYLRNDSVLDMSRHIPLYVCVLSCARALHALRCRRLAGALRAVPQLLSLMSRTTNSYASKLRMSKKNIFGKMTYSQRFNTASNCELSEEDEGLAALIADIQATSALMCRSEGEAEAGGVPRPLGGASREARYINLMRTMQFETFEMLAECSENGYRFTVPYHFEGTVRAAGERAHPARMKRLAQEAATLATSLPLSYSSSVFVRTDTDRLDVMKVLITGPSDTPYANGCFILDVYFPAEYPAVPMLINLETTGRHSVRFNPNLYNDGKVCLSVLNTWHGRPEEKWNAHTSSFLQVLVSIQSLILVPEPYFNEPGYERSRGTRVGSNASLEYNSNIYQACVRWAMLDHLRNPEPCFKEVIQTHFWIKRNEIMQTVANWITELEGQNGDERTQRSIQHNLMALKRHYVKLQEELAKLPVPPGLEDLDEPFQLPAAPSPPPAPAGPHSPRAPRAPLPLHSLTNEELYNDMEKIVAQVLE